MSLDSPRPSREETMARFMKGASRVAGFKRDMPSLRTVARGATRVEEIRLKRLL